jgi:hypothetical protein
MFIGAREVASGNGQIFAADAASGEKLEPAFGGARAERLRP